MTNVLHSSKSVEWYTPPEIIEAARRVMGGIAIDPASSKAANKVVKATRFYTEQDNGLEQHWTGNVWLNPPYGRGIYRWTHKAVHADRMGYTHQICLLVNATPSASWFRELWDYPICFFYKRLKFWSPDSPKACSPTHGSALAYMTRRGLWKGFEREFTPLGHIVLPR